MKTVKELLSEGKLTPNTSYLAKFDKRVPQGYPSPSETPAVITLQRKAIRVYPDNQKIALYYSPQLDKYLSIPFGPEGKALGIQLSESEQLDEFLPALGALAMGAARVAGPALVRGAAAAGETLAAGASAAGRGLLAGGQKGLSLGRRALNSFRQRQAARNAAKQPKAREKFDINKVGGKLDKMEKDRKAANSRMDKRDASIARQDKADSLISKGVNALASVGGSGQRNFQFSLRPTVGEPVSSVSRANNIARERQNANQIWNTNSSYARAVSESNLTVIHKIIESNERAEINFNGENVVITPRIAKKLVNVYESLNTKNKKNFEGMLNESLVTLQKAINFAIKKA